MNILTYYFKTIVKTIDKYFDNIYRIYWIISLHWLISKYLNWRMKKGKEICKMTVVGEEWKSKKEVFSNSYNVGRIEI